MKASMHVEETGSCSIVCTCDSDIEFDALAGVLSAAFQIDLRMTRVKGTDGSFPPLVLSFNKQPTAPRVIAVPGAVLPINGGKQ